MPYLIYIVTFFFGFAGWIIAFCYVLRSGRVVAGALLGWGLSIICVFLVSVVFPAIVALYNTEYAALFPEEIGVPALMVTGWVPGLLIAIIAKLVKQGIKHCPKMGKAGRRREEAGDHPS